MIGAMNAEPKAASLPAIRIESDAVSVWQSSLGFGLMASAAALGSITAGVSALFAALALVVLVFGRRWAQTRAARPQPAVVSVQPGEAGRLFVERRGKRIGFDLANIVDCWFWPDARGVNVVVATKKSMLSIQVPDREGAASLIKALGVDTSRQLVGTTLTAAPVSTERRWRQFGTRHLPDLAAALPVLALVALFLSPVTGVSPLLAVTLLLVALLIPAIIGLTREMLPPRVQVGKDGVLLSSLGHREFIGYERIKHTRRAPFAATLTLTNDEIVLLPMSPIVGMRRRLTLNPNDAWTRDPDKVRARRQALVEQIDAALTRFRNAGSEAAAVARLLERGPRSIAEWRDAITRAAAGGYRETHVDAETLVDIVENPRSPVSQRLGAALALTELPDESSAASRDGRNHRIRAAVASSANPRVRIALERAAEGTLDDATYERALEAEASSGEKAAVAQRRAR
jgi:hypothetical protein